MNHSGHAKLHKKFKKSISKWWYVGAVVAFTVVANFIGLIVFLGLSTSENESTTLPTETQTYRITSRTRDQWQPRDHRHRQVVAASLEEVTEIAMSEEERELFDAKVEEIPKEENNSSSGEHPGAESLVDLHNPTLTFSSSSEDVTLIPDDAESRHLEETSTLAARGTTETPSTTTTFSPKPTRPNSERTPTTTPTPTVNNHRFEKRLMQMEQGLNDDHIERIGIQDFKPLYDPKKNLEHQNELYSLTQTVEGPEHRQDDQEGSLTLVDSGDFLDNYTPTRYDNEEPETGTNPFSSFLQGGLQDIYEWMSTASSGSGGGMTHDLKEVLRAVNSSIVEGNSSILLWKLKEMYNTGENDAVMNITDPSVLSNSSSLVSVGLLAFDLLLLYNVQQIAWEDRDETRVAMLRDPEVVAMNALFLSPGQLRELREPEARGEKKEGVVKGVLEEALTFVNSAMRAVLTLGRAYRSSKEAESGNSWNTLDCVWTLYCRNLDKTARLPGLYGFLAKMNSLGLRLVMGDFPVEHALDLLIMELMRGSAGINCEKIFPKCSPKTAVDVVMRKALGARGELATIDVRR